MKRTISLRTPALALLVVTALAFLVSLPSSSKAFPFGGQAYDVHNCYNQVIYVVLGPPNGGPFIWAPSTRTYAFGGPSHAGQWMLGLAGVQDYCVYTLQPIDVRSGARMTHVGTSR